MSATCCSGARDASASTFFSADAETCVPEKRRFFPDRKFNKLDDDDMRIK